MLHAFQILLQLCKKREAIKDNKSAYYTKDIYYEKESCHCFSECGALRRFFNAHKHFIIKQPPHVRAELAALPTLRVVCWRSRGSSPQTVQRSGRHFDALIKLKRCCGDCGLFGWIIFSTFWSLNCDNKFFQRCWWTQNICYSFRNNSTYCVSSVQSTVNFQSLIMSRMNAQGSELENYVPNSINLQYQWLVFWKIINADYDALENAFNVD